MLSSDTTYVVALEAGFPLHESLLHNCRPIEDAILAAHLRTTATRVAKKLVIHDNINGIALRIEHMDSIIVAVLLYNRFDPLGIDISEGSEDGTHTAVADGMLVDVCRNGRAEGIKIDALCRPALVAANVQPFCIGLVGWVGKPCNIRFGSSIEFLEVLSHRRNLGSRRAALDAGFFPYVVCLFMKKTSRHHSKGL